MNRKRILLVSVGILGILTVILGTAGFILTTRSTAQSDAALSDSPTIISGEQSTTDYEAKYDAFFAEKKEVTSEKDVTSGSEGYMSDDSSCSHDSQQSIDWSKED